MIGIEKIEAQQILSAPFRGGISFKAASNDHGLKLSVLGLCIAARFCLAPRIAAAPVHVAGWGLLATRRTNGTTWF